MTAWKRSLVGFLSASSADAASPTVTGVMCQLTSISSQDPAVRRVVVDDEHAEAFERRRPFDQLARRSGGSAEDRGEVERAPLAHHAFDPEAAAHQLDELARDRQTQTGAAKAAGRRSVGLRERLENLVVFLGADADSRVRDAELQGHGLGGRLVDDHARDHFALGRELDGIPHHVQQHLPQTSRIADQRVGHIGGDVIGQLDAFFRGAQGQELGGIADRLAQVEVGFLQVEAAGFDLRKIEHVIDHAEERLGRRLHRLQVLVLLRRQPGLEREPGHAEDGIERRANLMAHVRQKRALGVSGLLRRMLRDLQLLDETQQP